jgi:hypothetical protein
MHKIGQRDIFAVTKGGVHYCLVLEKRKSTDGCYIDLNHGKLARFVRAVSNDGDRFSRQVAVKLGTSEEQNIDLAKLIFIRVWYVYADPINWI